jgi:hypothetical protein
MDAVGFLEQKSAIRNESGATPFYLSNERLAVRVGNDHTHALDKVIADDTHINPAEVTGKFARPVPLNDWLTDSLWFTCSITAVHVAQFFAKQMRGHLASQFAREKRVRTNEMAVNERRSERDCNLFGRQHEPPQS